MGRVFSDGADENVRHADPSASFYYKTWSIQAGSGKSSNRYGMGTRHKSSP